MLICDLNKVNPVFLVWMIDQYGNPVTGITAPTVQLSKSQGADTTTISLVENTDYTWHELTNGDSFKGYYKIRQTDDDVLSYSMVDTAGICLLSVIKTTFALAAGLLLYGVGLMADFLDLDLGLSLPTKGTVRESLMVSRAHAVGTRKGTSPDTEQLYLHDGATLLAWRNLFPAGGPYTILQESGDFTNRPAAGTINVEGPSPWVGGIISPPVLDIELDNPGPTTKPWHPPTLTIEVDGPEPTVAWV